MQIKIHEFIQKWHMDPLWQFDKIYFPLFSSLPSLAKGAIFGADWNPPDFPDSTWCNAWISLGLSLCKNTLGGVLTVKIC